MTKKHDQGKEDSTMKSNEATSKAFKMDHSSEEQKGKGTIIFY